MKKIILIGRSGCGKTTLKQALKGQPLQYEKTQTIQHQELIIDTPGEYIETKQLGYPLALYSYEADVVGLVISALEPYSLLSPNITCMANREVIGIITQIDQKAARPQLVDYWLKLAGCKTIFHTSAYTREGIEALRGYLEA